MNVLRLAKCPNCNSRYKDKKASTINFKCGAGISLKGELKGTFFQTPRCNVLAKKRQHKLTEEARDIVLENAQIRPSGITWLCSPD